MALSFPLAPDVAARCLARAIQTAERKPAESKALAARETPLHSLAEAHLKSFLTAVRYAFAKGRKAVKDVPRKLAADVGATAVHDALLDVMPGTLSKLLAQAGAQTVDKLPRLKAAEARAAANLTMKFDASDPNAVDWASKHAADLATQISDTTRDDIRAAIVDALENGDDPEEAIFEAVGDDARAELIARTEIMSAANEGQRQGWDQAVEKGLLDEDSQRVWIATDDACDICADLDGEKIGLDEEYSDGSDGPPQHPRCRCTEGLTNA